MKSIRVLSSAAVLGCLLGAGGPASVSTRAGDASPSARTGDFGDELERRMPGLLEKYGVPGAVISRIEGGEVTWTKAFGYADLARKTPLDGGMVFEHGSNGKVVTAWGVMRLVEQGKVGLDVPVNRYLKRWQIRSSRFDPDGVTLRRLLSHTAGLTVHGFADYTPRRPLPTLVELLEGKNQGDGPVVLDCEPGSVCRYSGGGFAVVQMVIEDVTGEAFADFIRREVTDPLGAASMRWSWTPELASRAPTPHWLAQERLEYRQLACQSIGSEIATVPDFARIVAAAVPGPRGEPIGRGVLRPETIAAMVTPQPGANGTGLAYGIEDNVGQRHIMHFGGNPGWNAHFVLDLDRRQGFVIAAPSARAFPFEIAVHRLWRRTFLPEAEAADPPPEPSSYGGLDAKALWAAIALAAVLLLSGARLVLLLRWRRRAWAAAPSPRGLLIPCAWLLAALAWWYWFYSPFPLPLPTTFVDTWASRNVDRISAVLAAGTALAAIAAFTRRASPPAGGLREACGSPGCRQDRALLRRGLILVAVLGCAILALFARPWLHRSLPPVLPAGFATGKAGDGKLAAVLEEIRAANQLPALAAASMNSDGIVEMAAVGVRAEGFPERVAEEDRWHLGSITKPLTATLAARLIEKGTISWGTTIEEVFPDLREGMRPEYRSVRLEELLHHVSGIPRDVPADRLPRLAPDAPARDQRQAFVAVALGFPPASARGSLVPIDKRFIVPYSNCGFVVAGAMMERRADTSFEDLMAREVFVPLGMTHSGFGPPGAPGRRNQPWGHRLESEEAKPLDPGSPDADNPPFIAPAGRIHTTLADMARFAAVHLAGARGIPTPFLSAASFRKLQTAPDASGYALDWVTTKDNPFQPATAGGEWAWGRILIHTGCNGLWYAALQIAPDRDLALFTATNAYGDSNGGIRGTDQAAQVLIRRIDAAAPSRCRIDPELPIAGHDVSITYMSRVGPLAGSKKMQLKLHYGFDGWQGVQDIPMTRSDEDRWEVKIRIPTDVRQIDFCFTDGDEWDNNSRRDWHIRVKSGTV